MKERGLILAGHEVRAALAGTKKQHRLPIALREFQASETPGYDFTFRDRRAIWNDFMADALLRSKFAPWKVGDVAWVRECWTELLAVSPATDGPMKIGPGERLIEPPTKWIDREGRERWNYDGRVIAYAANSDVEFCDGDGFSGDMANRDEMARWRSSSQMPRWASRLSLRITDVRIQRLMDVTEDDAIAMGYRAIQPSHDVLAKDDFFLNDGRFGMEAWARNDWTWALTWEVMT